MNPNSEPRPFDELRKSVNVLMLISRVLAFPAILVMTRPGTWGVRYLGVWAAAGFFWPLFFVAFFGPHPQIGSVFLYWQFSLLWLLVHRGMQMKRRLCGLTCGSHYSGQSLSEKPGDDYEASKKARRADSLLVIVVSVCLLPVVRPLAVLFLLSGVARVLVDAVMYQTVEARLRQMNDARIENEFMADLFRRRRGES